MLHGLEDSDDERREFVLLSDAVFGVKNSLVVGYLREESPERAAEFGVEAPFYRVSTISPRCRAESAGGPPGGVLKKAMDGLFQRRPRGGTLHGARVGARQLLSRCLRRRAERIGPARPAASAGRRAPGVEPAAGRVPCHSGFRLRAPVLASHRARDRQ